MPGFGRKTHWIAVRDRSVQEVADALDLVDQVKMPWAEGTDLAYKSGVFVAPPVRGWTLAHGRLDLVPPFGPEWEPLVDWTVQLSARLGDVQCFGSERSGSSYQWLHAVDRNVLRAYGVNDGDIPLFLGDPTDIELELGVGTRGYPEEWREWSDDEFAEWLATTPDEAQVLQVAARWSVDPADIAAADVEGLGIYGQPRNPPA